MKSKNFLDFLFKESQEIDNTCQTTEDLATIFEDVADLETMEGYKIDLVKILSDMGIDGAKERLDIEPYGFRLGSTERDIFDNDRNTLLNLDKITPLTDKGFVAIQGETDKDQDNDITKKYFILIIKDMTHDKKSTDKPIDMDDVMAKAYKTSYETPDSMKFDADVPNNFEQSKDLKLDSLAQSIVNKLIKQQ